MDSNLCMTFQEKHRPHGDSSQKKRDQGSKKYHIWGKTDTGLFSFKRSNGNILVRVLLYYKGLLQRGRDSFVLPIHCGQDTK